MILSLSFPAPTGSAFAPPVGAFVFPARPNSSVCHRIGKLIFSDSSAFSTGGALTCPLDTGVVNLNCAWGSAISIAGVQRIVPGDLVLWENR